MRLPRIRLTTVSVALLNAGLVAALVGTWKIGERRVHEPEVLRIHLLAMPDMSALNGAPGADINMAAIRDQAVFHNRRSFYQPPSLAIPPPDYELAGTMDLRDGKRIAFVKKRADQSSRTLHVGDDLEGWRVQSIEVTKVLATRDDQHIEVTGKAVTTSSGLIPGGQSTSVAHSGIRTLDKHGTNPSSSGPSN